MNRRDVFAHILYSVITVASVFTGSYFAEYMNFYFLCGVLFAPIVFSLSYVPYVVAGRLGFPWLATIVFVAAATAIAAHAVVYLQVGLVMPESDNGVRETLTARDAAYFSILTFTTLGYGDIQPTREYRLVAALEALYGYVFLGLLVGLLANAVSGSRSGSED